VGAEEGKGMAKVEIGGHGKRGGEKCQNSVDVFYVWPLLTAYDQQNNDHPFNSQYQKIINSLPIFMGDNQCLS